MHAWYDVCSCANFMSQSLTLEMGNGYTLTHSYSRVPLEIYNIFEGVLFVGV